VEHSFHERPFLILFFWSLTYYLVHQWYSLKFNHRWKIKHACMVLRTETKVFQTSFNHCHLSRNIFCPAHLSHCVLNFIIVTISCLLFHSALFTSTVWQSVYRVTGQCLVLCLCGLHCSDARESHADRKDLGVEHLQTLMRAQSLPDGISLKVFLAMMKETKLSLVKVLVKSVHKANEHNLVCCWQWICVIFQILALVSFSFFSQNMTPKDHICAVDSINWFYDLEGSSCYL